MRQFNFEDRDSWWILEEGMVVWNTDRMWYWDRGQRDALGRTFEAFVAYGEERFLTAMLSCFSKKENGKWYGRRFPTPYPGEVPISRDHVYNMTFALLHAVHHLGWKRYEPLLEDFIKNQPKRLSPFARQSLTMRLWYKLLQGKRVGKLYYPIQYLTLKGYTVWNKWIYTLTGVGGLGWEEDPDKFRAITIGPRPRILDIISGLLFPNYALMYVLNREEYAPHSPWKEKIRKACQPLVPKHNLVEKLLSNHPESVQKEDLQNYRSMTGDRWLDILNPWINYGRDIKFLPEDLLQGGRLDRDYLESLWERKNKK